MAIPLPMASMPLVMVQYGIVLAGGTYINKSDQKGIEPSPPVMIYSDWASLPLDDWSDLHTSKTHFKFKHSPIFSTYGFRLEPVSHNHIAYNND